MVQVTDGRLVEFSFASLVAEDVPRDGLVRLVRQTWSDNHRAGVTGVMRLLGSRLEQTIEGPSAIILALSSRILTDRRHCRIVVRSFAPVAERGFAGWIVEGLETPVEDAPPPRRAGDRWPMLACADLSPVAAVVPRTVSIARAT